MSGHNHNHSHRQRIYSPTRDYADQPRNSASSVYMTSYDAAPRVGGSTSAQPRSSAAAMPSARHSVVYEAQPARKSTTANGKTKTEYVVRPRNESSVSPETKRPLSVATRNLSPGRRSSAVMVASPREMTPTVARDDSGRLLLPASSHAHHHGHHQRHNSTSLADLDSRDIARERRDKVYNSGSGRSVAHKAYYNARPPARNPDDEGWSYTGPREQFDRDYPQHKPSRRESTSRKERPTSYYETERPSPRRDPAPLLPAPSRQPGRSERDVDRHSSKSGFDSDPDKSSDTARRRHSTRPPVLHQQLYRDDGYSSARDDHDHDPRSSQRSRNGRYDDDAKPRDRQRDSVRESDRDRDYERRYHRDPDRERLREPDRNDRAYESRRKPRSRESSPERSSLKNIAAGVMTSLATAGVVKGFSRDHKDRDKDDETDEDGRRERHSKPRRHRSRKDDAYDEPDAEEDRRKDDRRRHKAQGDSSSDTVDDQTSRSHRSRRRPRDDESASDDKPASGGGRPERTSSHVRTRNDDDQSGDLDRPSRESVPAHKQDQPAQSLESRTISPGENEDDRPRRVQLVEPLKEREEARPRGILKPARQVPFPEDPNPIREGVAPLKDATKDGIPPNARWTKINRLLVNPEALEKAHERFEEREDYVIVLRVLSREEIQKLADKTKEIRETREKEWQRRLEDRQQTRRDQGSATDSEGDGDRYRDDEESRPRLAIEAAPAPPANLHNLQNQYGPQVSARGTSEASPVPEINVEASYSQNV